MTQILKGFNIIAQGINDKTQFDITNNEEIKDFLISYGAK